jgi:hypothetical protein
MGESENYEIEKAYYSKTNDETVFLIQSFDGVHNCDDLNAETLNYAVMDSGQEQIGGQTWCVGNGYASSPNEYSTVAVLNCDDSFVVFFLVNSDSDKSKAHEEFYDVLGSVECT